MNIKRIISVLAIVVLSVVVIIALTIRSQQSGEDNRLAISASFYPLAYFAQQVGGDLVEVTTLTPPGIEPHDFEPTAKDIAQLQKTKLFLYNGSGLDPWADRLQADLAARSITVINMSNSVALRETAGGEEHEGHVDTDDQDSTESPTDPHFWLDPVIAQQEVQHIADELVAIDPSHAAIYQENAASYIKQLQELDATYTKTLATCATREIITSHAAFGYLAARYNLTVHAIAGLSPDQEPSAQQIADLTVLAQQEKITAIFFETLTSPRLAETLAHEIGAKTLVFNPLEGLTEEELAAGKTYVSVMQENLAQLQVALSCQGS